MPTLRTRQGRKRAFPKYHLPYRGLPPEIRMMIWRYYFTEYMPVWGPRLRTTSSSDTIWHNVAQPADAKGFFALSDRVQINTGTPPMIELLLTNKQTYHEALSVSSRTLDLDVRDMEGFQFEWFLSLIPRSLLPRIWRLNAAEHVRATSLPNDRMRRWTRAALLLRVDVIYLRIHIHVNTGNLSTQTPDEVAEVYRSPFSTLRTLSNSKQIINAIKNSDLRQLKIELCNLPIQVSAYLSAADKCIACLGIEILKRNRSISEEGFKVLPTNANNVITITKAS